MTRILADEPGYRLVASGNMAFAYWRQAPTVAAAHKMGLFVKEVSAECGRPVSIFVIIEDGIGLPEEPARVAMAESMNRVAPLTKLIVGVIRGEGFRAAVLRSIVAGMQLIARKAAPMRTFGKLEEAIDWLLAHDPSVGTKDEVRRALDVALTGQSTQA